jgi:16S rRNA C967 or C1407 C5-methylase (RsmB/RsmF family)/NOL1/NOP2/fmu family ribosome biogenesis protein
MNLPETFIFRTKALLGEEWDAFEQALKEEIPTSIRLNPSKINETPNCENIQISEIPWTSYGYYLSSRPSFTLDPLFHAGCYYVQEASSMYLEQIIKKQVSGAVKVLDLCAAPGGKSTHLASILPENSLLVANEVIRSRSHILAENIIKWGNPNTIVTNNDPAHIGKLSHFFNVILADVPCSGEGMFRKDPTSINEWSVHNVQLCAERQRRIIADVWDSLKPNGLLIYSTCTYNKDENEDNIHWICNELGAEIVEMPQRFMPHKTKGEGFFIAAIRKKEKSESNDRKQKRASNEKTITIPEELKKWLHNPTEFTFLAENNSFVAIPNIHINSYKQIKEQLKIISAGVALGESKGKDIVPAHALALSTEMARDAFPIWEINRETALKYLSKESFTNLPAHLSKGYLLVRFQNHSLGFVKNIGNRANNLYPQEWRIRMAVKDFS